MTLTIGALHSRDDASRVQALWGDLGTAKQVLSSNQCWPIIEIFSSLSGRLLFGKSFLDPDKVININIQIMGLVINLSSYYLVIKISYA